VTYILTVQSMDAESMERFDALLAGDDAAAARTNDRQPRSQNTQAVMAAFKMPGRA
jgi:hypothetical protein